MLFNLHRKERQNIMKYLKNISAATWQSLKAAMWQIKAKSGHILSTQVTNW